jgi:hypothetical protein
MRGVGGGVVRGRFADSFVVGGGGVGVGMGEDREEAGVNDW